MKILVTGCQGMLGRAVMRRLADDHVLTGVDLKDGDLGYDWLKSNSAGSGAFSLKTWKANEIVTLEANAG